jgi:hypothetical protein
MQQRILDQDERLADFYGQDSLALWPRNAGEMSFEMMLKALTLRRELVLLSAGPEALRQVVEEI